MHKKHNIRHLPCCIAVGLLMGAAGPALAEVYYEYVPVLEVTPIVESRQVPIQERVCEQREPDHRLSGAASGDVRNGRPLLSISEAAREDKRLWSELSASRERCRTIERYAQRQEVTGYRVEYVYDSERLVTRMNRDPGERVRVRVELDPVDGSNAGWARNVTPSGRSRYR